MPLDDKERASFSQQDAFDPEKTMEYPPDFIDQLRAFGFVGLPVVEPKPQPPSGFQRGYDGLYDGRVLIRRGIIRHHR